MLEDEANKRRNQDDNASHSRYSSSAPGSRSQNAQPIAGTPTTYVSCHCPVIVRADNGRFMEGHMRLVVLCLALASCNAYAAASCPAAEYAQYKDRAATKEGRHKLSLDYCGYRLLADFNR